MESRLPFCWAIALANRSSSTASRAVQAAEAIVARLEAEHDAA